MNHGPNPRRRLHDAARASLLASLLANLLWPLAAVASDSSADAACRALQSLGGAGLVITAATPIVPQPRWAAPTALGRAAGISVPFCRIEGLLQERIGFELWLPRQEVWNGRLLGAGVGGDAGVYNFPDLARAVTAGYAAATNDSGHKASETNWMMRREAVLDYTHRAQHEMNVAARRLVQAYFGRGPHHAYFLGCSGGGRQALKNMQRYPGDYDGIIAGAPAPNMPVMSARHLWQALYQQRNPEGAMSDANWQLVARSAVKACDADDGLADGVVGNPARCNFDPAVLQCRAGAAQSDCLSAAQLQTVRAFMAPLRDEQGTAHDGGLLPGVSTRPGPPSPLLLPLFAQGAHGNLAWRADDFHMADDLALVNQRMPEMRADDADLRPFLQRGGKAILYQGWLDPSVIAGQSLDYFAKVKALLGTQRTDDSLRLYMVPGMLHCRGGDGVDQFGGSADPLPVGDVQHDLLTAMTRWVEDGVAPQALTASRLQDGRVVRQRPLCPHPQSARYVGGDPDSAASFRCEATPQRIDGRHAQGSRWAIDMPANWNGTLLLWSRGYGSGPQEQPPETAPRGLRDGLLAQGYALAASNYTGPEWALQEAPRDQLEVLDAFEQRFGKARRTLAWGNSMGGLVSIALAERHAARIDGALPMCGSVSGSVGMLNTALDGAFAFKTLVAPDSDIRVVDIDDDRRNTARVETALAQASQSPQGRARVVLAAVLAHLPSWTDPASPEPANGDHDAVAEQLQRSFLRGVFLPRTDQERRAGGVTSWNTGIDYAAQLQRSGRLALVEHHYRKAGLDLQADLARLAAAPRIAASPSAVAYMRANYVPSGRPGVPVLTMQTTGDGLTVPATHGSYARAVRDAGYGAKLGQLWLRGAGHCTFSAAETLAALRTLEQRVDGGRWSLEPSAVSRRGSDAAGGTRFIRHREPPLLRHCGAAPGRCDGEPQEMPR